MSPDKNKPSTNWQDIHKKLLDPLTGTLHQKHFLPILKKQLLNYKHLNLPLSLVVLRITNLPLINGSEPSPKAKTLIKNIVTIIKKKLRPDDIIFYDKEQQFIFILPKANKATTAKILRRIKKGLAQIYINKNQLVIKGGYSEFPTDAQEPLKLKECAIKALAIAYQLDQNRIIAYFQERRKTVRVPVQTEVRYNASGSNERLTCSRNLSETGIMVSGSEDLPSGDNLELTFGLPGVTEPKINILAKVVWNKIRQHTDKMDIGLCFTHINKSDRDQIREYIQSVLPPIT